MRAGSRPGPLLVFALVLAGCATTNEQVLDTAQSQVQLRAIQSRAFDTTDIEKTLRTAIATLQDLGFVIDKADLELGTVSATKLGGRPLRVTVTVRERGTTQVVVRASAQYAVEPVTNPVLYQQFFQAFEKAMFLTAQEVD